MVRIGPGKHDARALSATYLDGVELVYPRPVVVGVPPERDLQLGQELVHARQECLRSEARRSGERN